MLSDLQRRFAGMCLAPSVREADVATFEAPRERLLVYRTMVRVRITEEIARQLPSTFAAPGSPAREDVARWLDEETPRTRFFRELPGQFAAWAAPRWGGELGDRVTFEAAKWDASWRGEADTAVVDFDFALVPVVSATCRLLALGHAVQAGGEAKETHLAVHRRPADHVVETTSLTPLTADLVREWMRGEKSATEATRTVTAARGVALDQRFAEGLGGVLARLLESGLLRGSRPPA